MTDGLLKGRINLERAAVLVIDDGRESMSILVQILAGFGVKTLHRCRTDAAARELVSGHEIDLIVANANSQTSDCYEFVRWLRRSKLHPNAMSPVILVSGHCRVSDVHRARDCGADFTVAKPVSPAVLLERIVWVAREHRPYISVAAYVGPDRRFHDEGPPEGMPGRRAEDAEAAIALTDSASPVMSAAR